MAKFNNPLFDDETGITVESLAIDWLHALSLGVFQEILGPLIWALLRGNAFGVPGTSTNLTEHGLSALVECLWNWYKEESQRGIAHTRIQKLTMGMIGTATAPT